MTLSRHRTIAGEGSAIAPVSPVFCRRNTGDGRLARLAGRGGLGGDGAAAAVEGPLLVVPGGAPSGNDDAVMVRVEPVAALAEAAVAARVGASGDPVVVRHRLVEPGAVA